MSEDSERKLKDIFRQRDKIYRMIADLNVKMIKIYPNDPHRFVAARHLRTCQCDSCEMIHGIEKEPREFEGERSPRFKG